MGDQNQINDLKTKIQKARQDGSAAFDSVESSAPRTETQIQTRKYLRGHFGKVYACDWAGAQTQLISASQDGKLIIWNARTANKILAIPLRSSWVMSCTYDKTTDEWVASGGLDNLCSLFKIRLDGTPVKSPEKELAAHDGYLSCCRFVGDSKTILTASGDATCMLWDCESGQVKQSFNDHVGDVMSVALSPSNQDVFVSGSCDASAKVWDIRAGKCTMSFKGHESDVNSVAFFPDGNAFATGSDDSSCRLWDLRAMTEVNQYGNDRILCGITSVEFSKSGRLLFGGYDDHTCLGWDVVGKSKLAQSLSGHENRISCLSISSDGYALCTGSWDTQLRIWV